MNSRWFQQWFVLLAILSPLRSEAQAASAGPAEAAELRWFFLGLEALKQTNIGTTFRDIIALPESRELKARMWDRVAPAFAQRFIAKSGPETANPAELLRPFFTNWLEAPSYFEIHRSPTGATEWLAAIRLTPNSGRAQDSLARLVDGWRYRSTTTTNQLALISTNSWLGLVALSGSPGAAADGLARFPSARPILERHRPAELASDQFFRLEGNPGLLVPRLWPSGTNAPALTLTLQGRGDALRTEGRLRFPHPVNWNLEAWRIPTNSIGDPNGSLMSFTVVRGFRAWAAETPWVKALSLREIPNQLFAWQDAHALFQVFSAIPIPGAAGWLREATNAPLAPLQKRLASGGPGGLEFRAEDSRLMWAGLPWIVPYLLPVREGPTEYMLGGLFPLNEPKGDRAPDPLLQQLISRTNLLYYDWELTEVRLAQLRPLGQLLSLLFTWPQIEPDGPIFRWLEAASPKLGNTVTEVAVISPREVGFLRNSHVGVSAIELLVLAHWMQMEQFPAVPSSIGLRTAPPSPATPP